MGNNQNLRVLVHKIKSGDFQQLKSFFLNIDKLEESFVNNYHKRKKEGMYYTAKDITKFIATEALIFLINKKLREKYPDSTEIHNFNDLLTLDSNSKQLIIKTLLNTTVCDPACGSGIFLLNAIDLIFNIIIKLDPSCNKNKIRKKLVRNCYGFDINEHAIGLSILKLFKWCQNEEQTEINGIISQLKDQIKTNNPLIDSNIGKFDIIIGNPPYGNILNKIEKEYLKEENSFYNDIYCTFAFKALNWSKEVVAFLVPKSFLLRQGYIKFRNRFLTRANVLKIIDIGSKLFKDATNEVQIILYEIKSKNNNKDLEVYDFPETHIITYKNQKVDSLRVCLNAKCPLYMKSKKLYAYTYNKACPYCSLETDELNRIRVKPNPLYFKLINKIEKKGDLNYLNQIAFPDMIRGEEDKGLKLVREKLEKQDKGTCFFINARNDFSYFFINKNKSFNIEEIDPTNLKGNHFEYYLSPKLLIKHNNIIPETIYSEDNVCFTSSIYSLLHHDSNELKFLCSIFNSILIQFYCTYAINNQKNTTINLNQYMIRHIPIINLDTSIKMDLVKKVEEITKIFQKNQNNSYEKTRNLLQEMDNIIFNAYSILDDEKKVIISNIKSRIKHFANIYE